VSEPEEWRVIADFPHYAASSLGQIKRITSDMRSHRLTGQPLKPGVSSAGYESVSLCRDGMIRNRRVNRIICAAFHGPAPSPDHHAAHNDGNRRNNRADNLRWVLPVENESDKRTHGTARVGEKHWSKFMPERRARGEGHGLAKLTVEKVRAIRTDTRKQREIARDFGISQTTVGRVKNRSVWSHVA
jgi:hypothetical protein